MKRWPRHLLLCAALGTIPTILCAIDPDTFSGLFTAVVSGVVFTGIAFFLLCMADSVDHHKNRQTRNLCPNCNYDLRGCEEPGCPECRWRRA